MNFAAKTRNQPLYSGDGGSFPRATNSMHSNVNSEIKGSRENKECARYAQLNTLSLREFYGCVANSLAWWAYIPNNSGSLLDDENQPKN